MDDTLQKLRDVLNKKANMSDDMIVRGVGLTTAGYEKLSRHFGTDATGMKDMLQTLAREIKRETLNEMDEMQRYHYESDYTNNVVVLRDSKTGSQKIISGSEAQELLAEIDRIYPDYQPVIAPYFAQEVVMEFADVEMDTHIDSEIMSNGGTYNFPYQGKFATARFWSQGSKFHTKVISLRDRNGDEFPITGKMREDLELKAFEWIDKV